MVDVDDIVMFDTAEVTVLVDGGKRLTVGCLPHDCRPIEVPKKFEGFERKPGPMVLCKQCKQPTMPAVATFSKGEGWHCHKCVPV